jgi:hypothetical protein
MDKKRSVKKLTLSKETLRQLEPGDLRKANGGAEAGSWQSDCDFTCGANSCAGVCTANCSWFFPFCPTA